MSVANSIDGSNSFEYIRSILFPNNHLLIIYHLLQHLDFGTKNLKMNKFLALTSLHFLIYGFTSGICSQPNRDAVIVEKTHDVNEDVEKLYRAMKGFGTSEKDLDDVIILRTNKQRQNIIAAYKERYNKDLIADIKSEISGNYQALLIGLTYPLTDFLAEEIHKGLEKDDHWAYMQILLTIEKDQIQDIKKVYLEKYQINLLQHIENKITSVQAVCFLLRILGGNDLLYRSRSLTVNAEDVKKQVKFIPEENGKCSIENNGLFFNFLATYSLAQIGTVVRFYDEKKGNGAFYKTLKDHCSDEILRIAYSITTQFAGYGPQYFASILKDVFQGSGTKEDYLNRILIWRSEIDLNLIKNAYIDLTGGGSLEKSVKGDTSSDYENALLTLLQGNYQDA